MASWNINISISLIADELRRLVDQKEPFEYKITFDGININGKKENKPNGH